jgi:hypothetical protein
VTVESLARIVPNTVPAPKASSTSNTVAITDPRRHTGINGLRATATCSAMVNPPDHQASDAIRSN